MAIKYSNLEKGQVGLIQETEDGKIVQVALTKEQSEMLQLFVASISQESPLIVMGEDYELVLKNTI